MLTAILSCEDAQDLPDGLYSYLGGLEYISIYKPIELDTSIIKREVWLLCK
jgi:hypothetical protein